MNTDIVITGIGVVSSLGKSEGEIANKLLRGVSGITAFSFQPSAPEVLVGRIRSKIKTATADRWPINRATALALKATEAVLPGNGNALPAEPRLGVIHATAYGNLQSLLSYQADLRKYGLRRASPMQFPNTILHAAASFLSIGVGANAFNITLSNENVSGLDAIETASRLLELGMADRVLVVTSEEISAELIPMLESSDELDWKAPDPFGEKRAGYVTGEAAVAVLLGTVEHARKTSSKVYARLCGSSGVTHGPHDCYSCQRTMRMALENAGQSAADIGCIFASANGSRSDADEANAIAALFGPQVAVTTVTGAFGECGASTSLLSVAAAIYCGQRGYFPPTVGRSKYDRKLEPINLIRKKTKSPAPLFVVNAFNKTAKCSQVWQLLQTRENA